MQVPATSPVTQVGLPVTGSGVDGKGLGHVLSTWNRGTFGWSSESAWVCPVQSARPTAEASNAVPA